MRSSHLAHAPRPTGRFLMALSLVLVLVPITPRSAPASEPPADRQIAELEMKIVELLAKLPPEGREEARSRLLAVISKALEDPAPTTVDGSDLDPPRDDARPEAIAATARQPASRVEDRGPASGKADDKSNDTVDNKATGDERVAEEQPSAATAEVAEVEPRVVEPPPATPPTRPRRRRAPCRTLEPFDENDDGKINARDRYWRHLYLWIDKNRDGQAQERELESAYGAGVREIGRELRDFYRRKGSLGEIRRGELLLFDIGGDGFGGGRRVDDGALAVDADALRRGDGPSLLDADGRPITGIQPFTPNWQLDLGGGQIVKLECPGR